MTCMKWRICHFGYYNAKERSMMCNDWGFYSARKRNGVTKDGVPNSNLKVLFSTQILVKVKQYGRTLYLTSKWRSGRGFDSHKWKIFVWWSWARLFSSVWVYFYKFHLCILNIYQFSSTYYTSYLLLWGLDCDVPNILLH